MNVVVDTDILIDFFRGVESSKSFFRDILSHRISAFISVVTEAELLSGEECNDMDKKIKIEALLGFLNKVDVDSYLAQKSGYLRRTYKISIPDAIIAATALKLNTVLYTRNLKDFNKIQGLNVKSPY